MAQSDQSLIEQVIEEFERARIEGKTVNENRYQHIIEGYESLSAGQKSRLGALDSKFGTLASDLSTLSGDVSTAMKGIADGTRSDVIGKGASRVDDTAGKFEGGQTKLSALANKAGVKVGASADKTSGKIGKIGESAKKGVLSRGRKSIDSLVSKYKTEAAAQRKIVESGRSRVKAGYESLASKDSASRSAAADKVLSGYEKSVGKTGKLFGDARKTAKSGFEEARGTAKSGFEKARGDAESGFEKARATSKSGFEEARKTASSGFAKAREEVGSDATDAAGRTESRFSKGQSEVGKDYASARSDARDISDAAIEKAGQLGDELSCREKTR
jgi:hypothetical protein